MERMVSSSPDFLWTVVSDVRRGGGNRDGNPHRCDLSNGRYVGYRGKPINPTLGHRVWNAIFNDPYLPNIYWIIWNGRMWLRGSGWRSAPGGPPDSDAGHYKHIHVTYMW